jgi:hypothetical protein
MGSVDRNVVDLELTPIFVSMCEQFDMYRELTATGDPGDGHSDCGRRSGSLDIEVEAEPRSGGG